MDAIAFKNARLNRVFKNTGFAILALAILVPGFDLVQRAAAASADDLELTAKNFVIIIKNVGESAIEIQAVIPNDRAECTIAQPIRNLKVGEVMGWPSECVATARVTIKTNRGDFRYSFRR